MNEDYIIGKDVQELSNRLAALEQRFSYQISELVREIERFKNQSDNVPSRK